ncbi:response regulator transcription factor [Lactiplantibacillus pingfangensis]|uniref:response regulator transcription factor n=1 Tax=Lactiplantibacillus pingfangensis TaxID=2559915 RepID=UPI0010F905BD|nr:response regulator transcription factor [Lactiplantibacillus pingfangensis]
MKPKILLVEDHTDIQELLHTVLSPDYQVFAALDGIKALEIFNEKQPDMIILDLMLPNITGESVLKTIRKTSSIPILILTAIQSKTKTVALLQAGANDYLTKPFDIDELLARIQVQLRLTHLSPQNVNPTIQFNDISLDPSTHAITVAGHALNLPKKEFNLLKLLLTEPHHVFEKAQLYESVWGEPYQNAENTLNVHLSNLRIKLNALTGQPQYIVSVWGIGVRLI